MASFCAYHLTIKSECAPLSNNICIINTELGISYEEFSLKTFGYLLKIINLIDFQEREASFPTGHIVLQKLSEIADVKSDYFIGCTNLHTLKLDFIFKRDSRKRLLILNQAAVSRTRSLPIFQRWKWINDFNANVLIVNDPLLYKNENIKAGWWIGTSDCDTAFEFAKEISYLANKLNIETKNIFFYGSSAGGFASLQQASCLSGSTAIADIAQTDLFTYKYRSEVEVTANSCYGIKTLDKIEDRYKCRFRLIDRFKTLEEVPNIYILQNIEDTHHLLTQAIPLIEYLNQKDKSKYSIYCYRLKHPIKGGHYPLPRRRTTQFINKIMSFSDMCLNFSELEDNDLKCFDRYLK